MFRVECAGTRDQRVEIRCVETSGLALGAERAWLAVRSLCLCRGLLKKAQAELDAIIGSKRIADQRRQQYGLLPQAFDHFGFRCHIYPQCII